MLLDAGHFFSAKVAADGTPVPEMLVRNSWVMQGYQSIHHDVANLSHRDLLYAQYLFEKENYRMQERETPVVQGFISANVRAADSDHLTPPAYFIKELKSDRFAAKADGQRTCRVGVVGVTEMPDKSSAPLTGFIIDDPLVASRRAIVQARGQCDLLVVLAYVSEDTAFKLLDLNPEADVIIVPRARWGRTYQGNHGWLVYADPQTKQLGELRLYLDATGRVSRVVDRQVMLDDKIPSDPATEKLVKAARSQIATTVRAWLTRQQASSLSVPPTPVAAGLFVTAQTCGACHQQELAAWNQSAHAQAFAALEKRQQHFASQCIGCHTTGYERGGFEQALVTPHLSNVQCESCHGPGQAHIADPMRPYGQVATPHVCVSCHTHSDSPAFDFAASWAKIKH